MNASIDFISMCACATTQELQLELEAVRLRLLRRSQIIDVLRSAYVRDVVIIKNELMRTSGMTDEVMLSTDVETHNSTLFDPDYDPPRRLACNCR